MLLSDLDLTLISVYLVAILLFGIFSHFRSQTANALMDGGRNLPGWMIGLSLFGSGISSIGMMSFPALAYDGNMLRLVGLCSGPIAAYIAARFFVRYYRKRGYISAYTHFTETLGAWASVYAAGTFILIQTIRIGLIMYLTANAFSLLLDWEQSQIMILTGIVVTAYTFLGGIRAVILTDVLQGLLLLIGIVVMLFVALKNIPLSGFDLISFAESHEHFKCGTSVWDFGSKSVIVFFLFSLTNATNWRATSQNCVQRYIVAKNDRSARSALWFNMLLDPLPVLILFALGVVIYVFYQTNPEALAAMEVALEGNSKGLLAYFVATQIPYGLVGILIISILAAAMSSIDTSMNASATLILSNFVKPFRKTHLPDRQAKNILALASILQGAIGIVIALQFADVQNVYESFLEVLSLVSGVLFGLFLMGFFFKKVPSGLALFVAAMGIVCTLWLKYSDLLPENMAWLKCPIHPMMANITTTSLMVGLTWVLLRLRSSLKYDASKYIRVPNAQ